ncbi:hypothetical protein [Streptomyces reniochalinae]|uniref:hypothetical protein n=1 Tax=Streptomyces reniochalinae TaxID=2250578 RepID=UPI0011C05E07|nr:hypothetical protein [Streptomyces reniochalinae]
MSDQKGGGPSGNDDRFRLAGDSGNGPSHDYSGFSQTGDVNPQQESLDSLENPPAYGQAGAAVPSYAASRFDRRPGDPLPSRQASAPGNLQRNSFATAANNSLSGSGGPGNSASSHRSAAAQTHTSHTHTSSQQQPRRRSSGR